VLDEVIIVRRELGFPPLVAPIRQWLASQAVYNVLGESRYETIVKELKDYLRGLAGRPPKPPTKKLRQLVLGREEPITMRPAALLEPQVEEGRQNLQQRGLPADDGQLLEELLFPHLTAERRRNRAKAEKKEKPPSMPPPPEPQPVVEEVETLPVQGAEFEVEVEGELFTVRVSGTGLTVNAPPAGSTSNAAISPKKPAGGPGSILSPMQGLIVKLELAVGDQVESGDVVGVLEAMKMQNDIVAPKSGRVLEIYVKEGEVVGPNQPLLRIGE
ncbi:MAG: biotin/lipoyl-containing protein, partial [Candidatus Dormibacteraceae bacterium]